MIVQLYKKIRNLFYNKKNKWKQYYTKTPDKIKYDTGSLIDAIMLSATMYPNNVAIDYYNVQFTYKELIDEIKKCAKSLKRLGIKEDDVVTKHSRICNNVLCHKYGWCRR